MKKLMTLIFALFLLQHSLDAKALEFGVEGGLSYWSPNTTYAANSLYTATATNSTSGSAVAGVFIRKDINMLFDGEIGLYYTNKKDTVTVATTSSGVVTTAADTVQTTSYMIPLILRTNIVPAGLFNVGAGVYYEMGTSAGITTNGVSASYASSGYNHTDIGLIGSAQVSLPVAPLIHVLLDLRYLYGLNEQSTTPSTESVKTDTCKDLQV